MISNEALQRAIDRMEKELHYFEQKYQGEFLEHPYVGYGNKKTHCVNEATLPVLTCSPVCLERCARTCYVIATSSLFRDSCRRRQAQNTVLRRIDPTAYYEHFYRTAEKEHLPIRLSDGGDLENEVQVGALIAAARRHPTVHAILYTKRLELLPLLVERPATLHARYSAWEGDEKGLARARDLGFDATYVVYDGSGNCPYQKSYARYEARRMEILKRLIEQGIDKKSAVKCAIQQTDGEIKVWHCRYCAQYGTGCCSDGDIRFNVVGKAHWEQAASNG